MVALFGFVVLFWILRNRIGGIYGRGPDAAAPSAEAGSTEAAHGFDIFGLEATVIDELVELFSTQHSTPLAMVTMLPAAFEVEGRRHLDRGVLAVFHGADRHGDVPFPGRDDVDQVQVHLAEVAPVLRTGGELAGRRAAVGLENSLRFLHSGGANVAQRLNLDILDLGESLDRARSPHAETHDTDSHPIERLRQERQRLIVRLEVLAREQDEE